jgi:sugar phosphate isomerase/epimerase
VTGPPVPRSTAADARAPAELGIFARTFRRDNPDAVAAAVADAGFGLVQLNLNAFGLPTIPTADDVERIDYAGIRASFARRQVRLWGVSATYNCVHPHRDRRGRETAEAAAFIRHAGQLGADVVTLCSGTRDPDDIWRRHPGNDDASAWHDLRETLEELLPATAAADVLLGIEPEPGNVVRDARRARHLLDALGPDADRVGIVLDPANLVTPATAGEQERILGEAFDLLGGSVVCLHAKDVPAGGDGDPGHAAAGTGLLDYDLVLRLHAALPHAVPVVIQDAAEEDVPRVRRLLLDGSGRIRAFGDISA